MDLNSLSASISAAVFPHAVALPEGRGQVKPSLGTVRNAAAA
jgi:hypothetical protein